MATKVIVYVKGGTVMGCQSTDPETEIILYDQDNIDGGDEPPFSDLDLQELQTKATEHVPAEIKLGRFYSVF